MSVPLSPSTRQTAGSASYVGGGPLVTSVPSAIPLALPLSPYPTGATQSPTNLTQNAGSLAAAVANAPQAPANHRFAATPAAVVAAGAGNTAQAQGVVQNAGVSPKKSLIWGVKFMCGASKVHSAIGSFLLSATVGTIVSAAIVAWSLTPWGCQTKVSPADLVKKLSFLTPISGSFLWTKAAGKVLQSAGVDDNGYVERANIERKGIEKVARYASVPLGYAAGAALVVGLGFFYLLAFCADNF